MSTITYPSRNTEPLAPEVLAVRLTIDGCGLEELVRDCEVDAESLAQLLYSRAFQDHLKLRIDLAITSAKIRAAEALPDCLDILRDLTASKKPEVARRSAMTLLHIAGLPTKPAPVPPAPLPAPTPAATHTPTPAPTAPPRNPTRPPSSLSLSSSLSSSLSPPDTHAHNPPPPPAPSEPQPESDAPQLPITSYQLPSPPTPNTNQNPNDSAFFCDSP